MNDQEALVTPFNGTRFHRGIRRKREPRGSVYGFVPDPSGQSIIVAPSDFDSVVAMGSRFEVTYRVPGRMPGGNEELGRHLRYGGSRLSIQSTTQPIRRASMWARPSTTRLRMVPASIRVNGGGGTDTLRRHDLFVGAGCRDDQRPRQRRVLRRIRRRSYSQRFSTIELSDSTIAISHDMLTHSSAMVRRWSRPSVSPATRIRGRRRPG